MSRKAGVCLVGSPFALGQSYPGVARGPGALRAAGLLEFIQERGVDVEDIGDLGCPAQTGRAYRQLADEVESRSRAGQTSVVLGGDHGVAAGSLCGALRAHSDLGVIWVDAHGDMNTPSSSLTGNFHGMPLGLLLGQFSRKERRSYSWMDSCLDPARLVLVGVRELDPAELELIRRLGIRVYSAADVREKGMGEISRRAIAHISSAGDVPIHLSFDVDAIDPAFVSATGTPVNDGLTVNAAIRLCEAVARTRRLASMDLVEVNPDLARSPAAALATAKVGVQLIVSALSPLCSQVKTEVRSLPASECERMESFPIAYL